MTEWDWILLVMVTVLFIFMLELTMIFIWAGHEVMRDWWEEWVAEKSWEEPYKKPHEYRLLEVGEYLMVNGEMCKVIGVKPLDGMYVCVPDLPSVCVESDKTEGGIS